MKLKVLMERERFISFDAGVSNNIDFKGLTKNVVNVEKVQAVKPMGSYLLGQVKFWLLLLALTPQSTARQSATISVISRIPRSDAPLLKKFLPSDYLIPEYESSPATSPERHSSP